MINFSELFNPDPIGSIVISVWRFTSNNQYWSFFTVYTLSIFLFPVLLTVGNCQKWQQNFKIFHFWIFWTLFPKIKGVHSWLNKNLIKTKLLCSHELTTVSVLRQLSSIFIIKQHLKRDFTKINSIVWHVLFSMIHIKSVSFNFKSFLYFFQILIRTWRRKRR